MGESGSKSDNANIVLGTGRLWFIGWLFTIGFAKLTFGKGLLAIVLWPYFLGAALQHIG